jgi:hypothetical protein
MYQLGCIGIFWPQALLLYQISKFYLFIYYYYLFYFIIINFLCLKLMCLVTSQVRFKK